MTAVQVVKTKMVKGKTWERRSSIFESIMRFILCNLRNLKDYHGWVFRLFYDAFSNRPTQNGKKAYIIIWLILGNLNRSNLSLK